jgi:hypothetical protein
MKTRAMICRALSGHSWEVSGPIVVLKDDARRITFHCPRCDTYRSDVWQRGNGRILTRYYKHGEEYADFIKSHDRAEARASLLATQKEIHGQRNDDNTRLRLVHGAAKKTRRRNTRTHKRPRNRKHASA